MPAYNTIEYVTISSAGNATDFGDLTGATKAPMTGGSSTRAFAGQLSTSYSNAVDYITIATTGNATDFGDLSQSVNDGGLAASNSIICLMFGGNRSDFQPRSQIDEFTIATTGNATDFGDLRLVPTDEFLNGGGGSAASNCHGGLS